MLFAITPRNRCETVDMAHAMSFKLNDSVLFTISSASVSCKGEFNKTEKHSKPHH